MTKPIEFGQKLAAIGTTVGFLGGMLNPGRKKDRMRAIGRGVTKGLGVDLGVGVGGGLGTAIGGHIGASTGNALAAPIGGMLGAIPGGMLGYSVADSMIGPYDDKKEEEEKEAADSIYAPVPYDETVARQFMDAHQIPYGQNVESAYFRAGRVKPGTPFDKWNQFQKDVGQWHNPNESNYKNWRAPARSAVQKIYDQRNAPPAAPPVQQAPKPAPVRVPPATQSTPAKVPPATQSAPAKVPPNKGVTPARAPNVVSKPMTPMTPMTPSLKQALMRAKTAAHTNICKQYGQKFAELMLPAPSATTGGELDAAANSQRRATQNVASMLEAANMGRNRYLQPEADMALSAAPSVARLLGAYIPGASTLGMGLDALNAGATIGTLGQQSYYLNQARNAATEHNTQFPTHPVKAPGVTSPKPAEKSESVSRGAQNLAALLKKPEFALPSLTSGSAFGADKPLQGLPGDTSFVDAVTTPPKNIPPLTNKELNLPEPPATDTAAPAAPAAPAANANTANKPGGVDWRTVAGVGSLGAGGLLALYYMMQQQQQKNQKPARKKHEEDGE